MTITDEQDEKLNFYIQELGANRGSLSDWERGFLDDQIKRYNEYGVKIFLSPKQWGVLDRMYQKVTEDGV